MDAKVPSVVWDRGNELDAFAYVQSTLAFEDLYRAEYPNLVAFATAMTGDPRASEDLVQDTMVKAFVRWSWLQRFGRPGAWCHRVLINACRDWGRRQRYERRFRERFREREPETAGPSAEAMEFWAAVRTLPTRPRLVVSLYYALEHTTPEVASILGVPEGTVRSDLTRARLALAKQLGVLS